jgi:hypothetical protein
VYHLLLQVDESSLLLYKLMTLFSQVDDSGIILQIDD